MIYKFPVLLLLISSSLTSVFAQEINQFDQEGKRHGIWQKKYENTDQLRYEGTFEHGKEVGEFKFYKPSSGSQPTATKQFVKDSDTVVVQYYTSKGTLISKGQMLNKKRVGDWTYFHQDGKAIMMTEKYIDGMLNGPQKTYFENGKLTEEAVYVNDKKEGKRVVYSEKGNKLKEFTYVNDKLEGLASYYEPDGTLSIEGVYKNDKKNGVWKYYENGKLKEEKTFPLKVKK
ncbi:toxin-antitoxin system YwqK family antitoxin [Aquimarina sp. ERC-38]|uniref:toxin-antitoxin system YwqK family antitoxin n=1 Tax=Aquimarina sp. ERC-38 TaxID=2949996 RepID=UPI0022484A2A|nr:toxin-antitoxin system YwqK family antitoxin [Aquimarina sp. ERC-38]UZO80473.1 toxin-antitoxin system YwqK family antitoxin [Aquimarina sp. ERC-38]